MIRFLSAFAVCLLSLQSAQAKCEGSEKVVRLVGLAGETNTAPAFLAKELQTEFQRSLNGKWCIAIEPLKEGVSAFESLSAGDAELAMVTLDEVAFVAPLHRIFELPFAFRDQLALRKFLNSKASQPLRKWKNQNVRSVALVPFGMEQIGGRKALLSPLDIAGLPFALTTEQATRPMIARLRATGRVVVKADLLKALEDKRFGAQMARWQSFELLKTSKFHSDFTQTNHAVAGAQILAAEKWAAGLKPADLATLERSIKRAVDLFSTRQNGRENQSLEIIMRSGKKVYLMTREQRSAWRKALEPLTNVYASLPGGKAVLTGVKSAHRLP